MSGPYVAYVFIDVYCILYTVTVLSRLNPSIGTAHEVRELRNMIYTYLGMLVTDILWVLFENDIIVPSHFINASVNALSIMLIALGCFFWYKFLDDRLHRAHRNRKLHDIVILIPITAICLIDVISIFTGWIFYIDAENKYQTTSLFNLQGIVNYFYLLIPTLNAAYRGIRAHTKSEQTEYLTYTIYMVAPLLGGLLEDTFPTVPVLSLNIFLVIHILFLMIQNKQIYNDALTDLNNRRRLDQYLDDKLQKASDEHPVVLLMMDINGFKSINDIYGHIEGDNALKTFSDVLKVIGSNNGAFIARYGGDEFCLVAEGSEANPQKIIDEIHSLLSAKALPNADYKLSISAGYTVCTKPENNINAVFARADDMLYDKKKEWHLKNA